MKTKLIKQEQNKITWFLICDCGYNNDLQFDEDGTLISGQIPFVTAITDRIPQEFISEEARQILENKAEHYSIDPIDGRPFTGDKPTVKPINTHISCPGCGEKYDIDLSTLGVNFDWVKNWTTK